MPLIELSDEHEQGRKTLVNPDQICWLGHRPDERTLIRFDKDVYLLVKEDLDTIKRLVHEAVQSEVVSFTHFGTPSDPGRFACKREAAQDEITSLRLQVTYLTAIVERLAMEAMKKPERSGFVG